MLSAKSPLGVNAESADSSRSQHDFLSCDDPSRDVLGGCDRGDVDDPDDIECPPPRSERYERIALCRLLEGNWIRLREEWFFDVRRRVIYRAIQSLRDEDRLVRRSPDPTVTAAKFNTRAVFQKIHDAGLWEFTGSAAHELREIVWAGESEPGMFPAGNLLNYHKRREYLRVSRWMMRATLDVFTDVDHSAAELMRMLAEVCE